MAHAGHPLVGDDVYGLQVGVLGVHVHLGTKVFATDAHSLSPRSVSQFALQRDPEGPSQPHVNPGTQSMSRL
jgi:23S rRNA-/tRNA-specific pseudouridylate synthase